MVDNRILMLHHLLDCLNPSCPEHRLADIQNLVSLIQGPTEKTAECMASMRGFDACLNKVTLWKVMNTCYSLGMTDNKYDGILSCYTAGDDDVVSANLVQLESLIMGEYKRKMILGLMSTACSCPVVQHTTGTSTPKKP